MENNARKQNAEQKNIFHVRNIAATTRLNTIQNPTPITSTI